MQRPSLHSNFFSSLKQVEKRLKLEQPPLPNPESGPSTSNSQVPETNPSPTESLATPLHLHLDQPATSTTNIITSQHQHQDQDSSEPPQAFLCSSSPQPLPTHHQSPPPPAQDPPAAITDDGVDDMDYLMQLLGLSDNGEQEEEEETQKKKKKKGVVCGGGNSSCGCECGFYEKIVGVKGPKCDKEVERMQGWITYFMRNGSEPLRLAFLLIAKAAFHHTAAADSPSECLDFPSVIDDFFKIDPPTD